MAQLQAYFKKWMSKKSLLASQVAIVLFVGCQGDTQSYFDEACIVFSSYQISGGFSFARKKLESPREVRSHREGSLKNS